MPGSITIGDLEVKRIGLGTNRISDNQASRSVLKAAVKLGVNFIDTAHRYGQSEEIIGQMLAPYPAGLVIATKGGWAEDNTPETLASNIDQSLRLLKVDQLDLWQLHRVDTRLPIERTMEFLLEQQRAGKIRHVGLSEVSIEQIEKARSVLPIVSVQNHYNLAERRHQDVLDYCTKEGIVFIPFFPLASGDVAQNAKLERIAGKYSATSVQIAIAWLLKCSPIMLPIPGTLSPEHLASDLEAVDIELSDEDFAQLNNF